jgi:hypothetical protein
MDLATAIANIHYPAVLLAAFSTFFIGGLWYSPLLFARPWLQDNGLSDADLKIGGGPVFAGAIVCAMIQAFVLALFLGPTADARFGAVTGVLVGLGWVAPALTTTFLFERRPRRLVLIDAAYHIVTYTVMGVILGAWH